MHALREHRIRQMCAWQFTWHRVGNGRFLRRCPAQHQVLGRVGPACTV